MAQLCPNCNRNCTKCADSLADTLRKQLEVYEARVRELTEQGSKLEHEIEKTREQAEADNAKLQEEHQRLRDSYDRLFATHKAMNNINVSFDAKLAAVAEHYDAEKQEIAEQLEVACEKASVKEQFCTIIQEENSQLRNDCRLAASLLRNNRNPQSVVAHRLSSFSDRLRQQVLQFSLADASGAKRVYSAKGDQVDGMHSEEVVCASSQTAASTTQVVSGPSSSGTKTRIWNLNPADLLARAKGSRNASAGASDASNASPLQLNSRRSSAASVATDDPFVPAAIIAEALAREYDNGDTISDEEIAYPTSNNLPDSVSDADCEEHEAPAQLDSVASLPPPST